MAFRLYLAYHCLVNAHQRLGDIIANAITHGVGAILAIIGLVILMAAAMARGSARHVATCAVFGITLVLVYLFSTLYHSLIRTRARRVLRILDHSAIYLLIAGTYTPFTLVSLRGRLGWSLFAIVWALAVAGVAFKSVAVDRFAVLSGAVYVLMGWMVVTALGPLLQAITWHGLYWLIAGGLLYTAGIVFFAFDRVPSFHALWHGFVLGGSACHFFAVLFYVIPHRS